MALARNAVILLSIFLIVKCFTIAWSSSNIHQLHKRDLADPQCRDIQLQQDQCAYVKEYCVDATSGLFNYMQLYYCSPVRPVTLLLMCGWLIYLFGFVGIAASDFFCPNLQTIASVLHLSESLTGVTFLAFGNGSPDLFSTFSAMQSNMGSLALGELIGAAAFIVSVVAGSMCAIKPFRAKKFSFIRDVSFFTCAIVLVMLIVSDGLIYFYEAVLLIVFYVFYVCVVVGGNYYMKRRSNYINLVERARLEYEENSSEVDTLLRGNFPQDQVDEDEMELYDEGFETEGYREMNHHRNGPHPKLRIRTSLFSAIEFQDVVQSLQSSHSHPQLFLPHRSRSVPQHERYIDEVSLHRAESMYNQPQASSSPPLHPTGASNRLNFHPRYAFRRLVNRLFSPQARRQARKYLFPALVGFRQKSLFSKVLSVASTPVMFLLTVTLPVVRESALSENNGIQLDERTEHLLQDFDDMENESQPVVTDMVIQSEKGWVKWLTAVQIVGGPLLISFVLITQEVAPASIVLPVALSVSVLVSLVFCLTTSADIPPRLHWMTCFVGFVVSVVWIFLIANEVVSVLQAIGMALGISEAVLGLTVFALGNSLGDFVANVTMAKMGYPLMAMSACFGGPMLNIMLGIGIGAICVTSQRNAPYPIGVSKTIVVTSIGLLVVLISSLILVPLNGFKMSRGFGYSWIAIYLICTAINLYIEIRT
ncbi:putative cation exchanger C3A12.06c [Choanephora cucurbitarum]|uniref:Putative cation exchanger C3A12.06c n=1 Tax=Choanephora cucurbitarum TaxID=101091 RepID=A0A1C7NCA5_9FUNG|nr:putative cation exchanger C3A12.06c [Choanephora cucurbitarum]